jgi:hypothetical protein
MVVSGRYKGRCPTRPARIPTLRAALHHYWEQTWRPQLLTAVGGCAARLEEPGHSEPSYNYCGTTRKAAWSNGHCGRRTKVPATAHWKVDAPRSLVSRHTAAESGLVAVGECTAIMRTTATVGGHAAIEGAKVTGSGLTAAGGGFGKSERTSRHR